MVGKSDSHGFQAVEACSFAHLLKQKTVSLVHTVEKADGGAEKRRFTVVFGCSGNGIARAGLSGRLQCFGGGWINNLHVGISVGSYWAGRLPSCR